MKMKEVIEQKKRIEKMYDTVYEFSDSDGSELVMKHLIASIKRQLESEGRPDIYIRTTCVDTMFRAWKKQELRRIVDRILESAYVEEIDSDLDAECRKYFGLHLKNILKIYHKARKDCGDVYACNLLRGLDLLIEE